MSREKLLKLMDDYTYCVMSYFEHLHFSGKLFNLSEDVEVSVYMKKKLETFRIGVKQHVSSILELGYNIENELNKTQFEERKDAIREMNRALELLRESMTQKNFMPRVEKIYEELEKSVNNS